MNKNGIERNIAGLLFVLVLVVFSFAERDSKKLVRLYSTAKLLKKNASDTSDIAVQPLPSQAPSN